MTTEFLSSVLANDPSRVQELLQSGCDPNQSWPDGITGLHEAAGNNSLEVGRVLVESHADLNVTDTYNRTPLYHATLTNNIDFVKYLLQGADINIADKDGKSPLHVAGLYGYDSVVDVLLSHGAQMDRKTSMGETALHFASSRGNHSTIRLLCEKGADANSTTADGSTSLSLAARFGHSDCLRLLIEYKADVEIENKDGMRALHEACAGNHLDVVDELLQYGADSGAVTKDGQMPYAVASSLECQKLVHRWIQHPRRSTKDVLAWMDVVSSMTYVTHI